MKGTKLIISEVNETDSGIYRCVARNAAGSDVWKTNLTVIGKITFFTKKINDILT